MLLVVSVSGQIPQQPIDSEATGATRQLYRYLRDKVWGKQVLSGCQARWDYNTMDADGIYERAGKYPAINIFDFQHFRQRNLNYMGPPAKAVVGRSPSRTTRTSPRRSLMPRCLTSTAPSSFVTLALRSIAK